MGGRVLSIGAGDLAVSKAGSGALCPVLCWPLGPVRVYHYLIHLSLEGAKHYGKSNL